MPSPGRGLPVERRVGPGAKDGAPPLLAAFGATIGMALGSTVLSATGSFELAFLATGGFMLAILLFAWFGIEPRDGTQAT